MVGSTFSLFSETPQVFGTYAGTQLNGSAATTNTLFPVNAVANGASSIISVANANTTGNTGTGAFPATYGIGAATSGAGNFWTGSINEFGLWPSAFSTTQLTNMCHNQRLYWSTTGAC